MQIVSEPIVTRTKCFLWEIEFVETLTYVYCAPIKLIPVVMSGLRSLDSQVVLHAISSVRSWQSGLPSHLSDRSMHEPLLHVNWLEGSHGSGREYVRRGGNENL